MPQHPAPLLELKDSLRLEHADHTLQGQMCQLERSLEAALVYATWAMESVHR